MPDLNKDDVKAEKKELVLSTLSFLLKKRNEAIFRLSSVKIKKMALKKEEEVILHDKKTIKFKINQELDKHKDILTKEDLSFYIESDEDDDD